MTEPSAARMLLLRSLGLAWLVTGHALLVPASLLPYGGNAPVSLAPSVAAAIATVASIGCVATLHPRTARGGALLVSFTILGLTAASEAYFANYRVFVACLLLVAVVAPPDRAERALRVQAALVYVGAAIDKLLDPAFRDGSVVRALVRTVAQSGAPYSPGHPHGSGPAYAARILELPDAGAAWLGAFVVALECAIALGYGSRSRRTLALAALLHVGIALVTGSTFGVFLHAAIAAAASLGPALDRRTELATLAFVVYASSPLERPLGVAFAAIGLVLVASRAANHSRIGSS